MNETPDFEQLLEFCSTNILCDICKEGTGVRDAHGGWTCPSCTQVQMVMSEERKRQGLE